LKVVDVQKESETAQKFVDLQSELASLREQNEVSLVVIKLVRKCEIAQLRERSWKAMDALNSVENMVTKKTHELEVETFKSRIQQSQTQKF
jgi:hypothetical protein